MTDTYQDTGPYLSHGRTDMPDESEHFAAMERAASAACPRPMVTMADASTGDDVLTVLFSIKRAACRPAALRTVPTDLLREAADLCLVDTTGMGRERLIRAVLDNF